jgi:thiosulfate reductase cytochrome b subunit
VREKSSNLNHRLLLILLLATFGYSLPALAADVSSCLDCHGGSGPAAEDDPHSLFFWRFTNSNYKHSAHAELDCTECHIPSEPDGFEFIPHHMDMVAIPECIDCHEDFADIVSQFKVSIHAVRVKSFRCIHCHDPHGISALGEKLPRPERIAASNLPCIKCHTTLERYQALAGPNALLGKVSHDWIPRKSSHKKSLHCILCHTPVDHPGVHEIQAKEMAQRSCDACHQKRGVVVLKYLGEPDRSSWISHKILFDNVYVMGATRNRLFDKLLIIFASLTLIGILIHGLLRVATSRRRERKMVEIHDEYFYSRDLRLWHWTHALLFLTLLLTGIRLHFGSREGALITYETAFHVHNILGAIEVVIGIIFLVINFFSDNAKSYFRLPPNIIGGMIKQARYYLLGVFLGAPHPFHPTRDRKFNPLQQVAYTSMMYIVLPVLGVTGVILLFSDFLPNQLFGKPGGWIFATIHYIAGAGFMFFLMVHLYLCTMGDRLSYLIRGMITGYHRSEISTNEPK